MLLRLYLRSFVQRKSILFRGCVIQSSLRNQIRKPMASSKSGFEYYYYYPSLAAAIIFVFLFFGTTAYHGYQASTRRSWYFIPLLIGGICMTPTWPCWAKNIQTDFGHSRVYRLCSALGFCSPNSELDLNTLPSPDAFPARVSRAVRGHRIHDPRTYHPNRWWRNTQYP